MYSLIHFSLKKNLTINKTLIVFNKLMFPNILKIEKCLKRNYVNINDLIETNYFIKNSPQCTDNIINPSEFKIHFSL